MIRSLWTGSNGMVGHQAFIDVIGNNVANTDTIGYRKSIFRFEDLLSQTVRGVYPSGDSPFAVAPYQVGNGPLMTSVDLSFQQGPLEITESPTDLAIQGSGFFCIQKQNETFYTRAGRFVMDDQGHLVQAGTGNFVLGVPYAKEGKIPAPAQAKGQPVKLPVPGDPSYTLGPKATSTIQYRCNLDSALGDSESYTSSSVVYDAQGNAHTLNLTWTKNPETPNSWHWSASLEEDPSQELGTGDISFYNYNDPAKGILSGTILKDGSETASLSFEYPDEGGSASIVLDFTGGGGAMEGVTQFGAPSTTKAISQDGYAKGRYSGVVVGKDGTVFGTYSNDVAVPLYRLSLASFRNPMGLGQEGGNLFYATSNSGKVQHVFPGEANTGTLVSGALEKSNVDTPEAFANVIVAQRGYQASARIVTTSDHFLEVAMQVKR